MKKYLVGIIATFAVGMPLFAVAVQPSVLPPAGYEDTVLTNIGDYQNPFPDTDMGQLAGKAAAELSRRTVVGGFPDGQFKGGRPVNRAEAAKFLLLARFETVADVSNTHSFPDVLDNQWFTKFVVTAAQKSIINGYPDGLFRPANQVNTAEFLKMLSLGFGLQLNLPHSYADVSAGDWFAPYAGIAQKYELFPGRSSLLHPESPLSREDVAVAIYQYLLNRNGDQSNVPTEQVPAQNECTNPADTAHMDIFDSHAHANSKVSVSQIISEMDKAGVSVANLYSGTLDIASQYPGRFITFVDTPDSPPSWLTQGQSFVTSADAQLKTEKYYGIGETNLRYYSGKLVPPPTVSIPADTPIWLQLVDISAQYHVPISFHFVPDDSTANAAFERMLSHNKNTILIWAHLGFNNMPLNSKTLNDFLLRYPHLYFDTAGIQNMQQDPAPLANSNWWMLTSQANNGQLNNEWRQFFETWNSRILFGSDAGGGGNGAERWLNYAGDAVKGATPNAVGHWTRLLSNLDSNSARNILSGNSRELFLKEKKPAFSYSVAAHGQCYSISVSSDSSVSALTFNPGTRAITFTVAGSNGTTGNAEITVPTALVGGNFTASVDGQSVKSPSTSSSTSTTISVKYSGGIHSITLSASDTP